MKTYKAGITTRSIITRDDLVKDYLVRTTGDITVGSHLMIPEVYTLKDLPLFKDMCNDSVDIINRMMVDRLGNDMRHRYTQTMMNIGPGNPT